MWTSSDTTEGTVSVDNLTFTSSNWNAEQTVTITGVADNLSDGDQSYAIRLLADNTTTATRYQVCGSSGCDAEEPGSDRQGQFLCLCGF